MWFRFDHGTKAVNLRSLVIISLMAIHRRLFFLLISLLPVQLGFHFWPEWSHVLGRRVDYLSPTLFITDLLIILLLASWFIGRKNIFHTPPLITFRNRTIAVVGILFFAGLNIVFAESPAVSLYKWMRVIEFAGLGWYIISTKVKIDDLFLPISISVVYTSLLAMAQFLHQHSLGGIFWWLGERVLSPDTPGVARFNFCALSSDVCRLILRPYATFPHPNALGGFFAVILPMLIYQWYGCRQKKLRGVYAVIFLLGVAGLFISFSRGAWFVGVLVGGTLMYALLRRDVYRLLSTGLYRLIIPGLITVFFIVNIVAFFPSAADESVVRRNELNSAAVTMWKDSPIIGVGLGNFLVTLPSVSYARSGNYLQPVHNIYLLILAEAGISGVIGIIVFAGINFRKRIKHITYAFHVLDHATVLVVLSVVAILLLGLIDHYPITLQQGQLLVTLFFSLLASRFR